MKITNAQKANARAQNSERGGNRTNQKRGNGDDGPIKLQDRHERLSRAHSLEKMGLRKKNAQEFWVRLFEQDQETRLQMAVITREL